MPLKPAIPNTASISCIFNLKIQIYYILAFRKVSWFCHANLQRKSVYFRIQKPSHVFSTRVTDEGREIKNHTLYYESECVGTHITGSWRLRECTASARPQCPEIALEEKKIIRGGM